MRLGIIKVYFASALDFCYICLCAHIRMRLIFACFRQAGHEENLARARPGRGHAKQQNRHIAAPVRFSRCKCKGGRLYEKESRSAHCGSSNAFFLRYSGTVCIFRRRIQVSGWHIRQHPELDEESRRTRTERSHGRSRGKDQGVGNISFR